MQNTSSDYKVLLYPNAFRDLDDIYAYISGEIMEPEIAKRQINRIWDGLYSLSSFPYSHQDRLVGRYANKGYKQLFVDNYLIIYRIDEGAKTAHVVTIQYAKRNI